MNKIAVTTNGEEVEEHFGHCSHYTIYTISEDNQIIEKELFRAPPGCGCKSDIGNILAAKSVNVILTGNIGGGAINIMNSLGMEVVRGCSGNIEDVVSLWLSGQIEDNGEICHHHDHDHHE